MLRSAELVARLAPYLAARRERLHIRGPRDPRDLGTYSIWTVTGRLLRRGVDLPLLADELGVVPLADEGEAPSVAAPLIVARTGAFQLRGPGTS